MIRYLSLFILIIFNTGRSESQIPNGGFEDWEQVLNYEKPTGWSTNQDIYYSRFEKDIISVEGNYSLKIVSEVNASKERCESRATMHVNFDSALISNSALTFYVKSIPLDSSQSNEVFVRLIVYAYDSITALNTYEWITYESIPEFTKVVIPLTDENTNAITIVIWGAGLPGVNDGPCHYRSTSWIDGMTIETMTSDENSQFPDEPKIVVYPNPSTGLVNIRSFDEQIQQYELYSVLGELVSKGEINNGQLEIHENGIYMLKLFTDVNTRKIIYRKMIVVK